MHTKRIWGVGVVPFNLAEGNDFLAGAGTVPFRAMWLHVFNQVWNGVSDGTVGDWRNNQ